jgi:hypothetical protein
MATYQSIRYNVDYGGKAGSLMPLSLFTSDGSDATADFTSGIDSTYSEYLFIFNNIHPETNNTNFSFQASIDSGSNYNVTTTNTLFHAFHYEDNSGTPYIAYDTSRDLAQSTSFTVLIDSLGTDNDQNASGYLRLFNPSSITFVKHFIANSVTNTQNDGAINCFAAGYFNTTSAVDAIQFKMSSGEIQGGTIGMFGVH